MERPKITESFADRVYVGKNVSVRDVLNYIEFLEKKILELKEKGTTSERGTPETASWND